MSDFDNPVFIEEIKRALFMLGINNSYNVRKWADFGGSDRVHIHPSANVQNAFFNTMSGDVFVDEGSWFGHQVMLLTGTHHDGENFAASSVPYTGRDIHVGKYVWLASRVTVCGPCRIGDYAIVGAGSVVTHDVEPYTFVAGNPAKFIRYEYPKDYQGERK